MSRARLTAVLLLLASGISVAAVVGGLFQIQINVIGASGSKESEAGSLKLRSVVGQTASSKMQGSGFELQNGYLGAAGVGLPQAESGEDDDKQQGDFKFDV